MTQRTTTSIEITVPRAHHRSTFRSLQLGSYDPTIRVGERGLIAVRYDSIVEVHWETFQGTTTYRATLTGDSRNPLHVLEGLVGRHAIRPTKTSDHPSVTRSISRHRHLRIAASGLPFIESVKAVIGQRITAHDAALQWSRLVRATSQPVPAYEPFGLYELPDPRILVGLGVSSFHRMGIEERRARTIRQLADLASRGHFDDITSSTKLLVRTEAVSGFGPWSRAVAVGNAFGDPDALPIGDFHHKNTVSWALTNRPRGTDEEMTALLEPYAGWRWWVTRCLSMEHRAPRFDHRRRNLDIRVM